MAKAMTKSQVTKYLSGKAGITKKAAGQFLEELASLAYKEAKNTFTLPGLGKLVLVNRKAKMGRNPQTGDPLKIPAKRVIKFRITKAAKIAILQGPGGGH
jgi:DNA-binding protein HU-beta